MPLKLKSYWSGKSSKECNNFFFLHALAYLFPFSGIKLEKARKADYLGKKVKRNNKLQMSKYQRLVIY